MPMIAALDVVLGINAGQFSAGMQQAGNQVKGFADSLKPIGNSLGFLVSGPVGTALAAIKGGWVGIAAAAIEAGRAMTNAAVSQMNSIASTGRLADQLNVTTQELMGLDIAARKSGLEAGDFGRALIKMQENISKAGQGGEGANVLNRLGLDAESLSRAGTTGALKMIADKIAGLGNSFEQAEIARAIFGRGGAEFLNTLRMGGQGIDEAIAKGKSFDTLTRAEVQQVQNARSALKDISIGFNSVMDRLAQIFAPVVQAFGESVGEMVKNFGNWLGKAGPFISAFIETAVAAFVMVKDVVVSVFGTIFGWLGDLGAFLIGDAAASWTDFANWILNVLHRIEFAFKNWKDGIQQGLAKLHLFWSELFGSDEDVKQAQDAYQAILEGINQKYEEFLKKKESNLTKAPRQDGALSRKLEMLFPSGALAAGSKEASEIIAKAMRAGQGLKGDPVPPLIEKGNKTLEVIAQEAKRTNAALAGAPVLAPAEL